MFDFTSVDSDVISSAVDEAIEAADRILEGVVDPATPPTFVGVLQPLDDIGDLIGRVNARTGFMGYVHPDEETRNSGTIAQQRLAAYGVEIAFRDDLYEAVRRYAGTKEAQDLEGEEARFLEFTRRDLRRAGHELDPASRARLKELSQRLVELGIQFQQNIDSSDLKLLVTEGDLEGLPEAYIESLETDAESGLLAITMAYPHVVPFMDNSPRRDLRERLSFLFNTRAVEANRPILEEVLGHRQEIADIFGLPSWAHFVLEERMAKDPARVEEFYDELVPPLTEKGREEIAAMARLLEADTGETVLCTWDWRFYDNLQRKTDFGVDQYEVAQYLPLGQVLDGLFEITQEVFGLDYRKVEDPRAWHPDVSLYEIRDADGGEPLAHFYLDLFPRPGKFSHAAEFPMAHGRVVDDGYQNPICAMVANFTKPTSKAPSLLQHSEVETFFHEFGHVLHQSLGRTRFARFSGTSVERDFVEAPSQIMQHWVWRSDVLRRFARHHQTGEPIPEDLVDQLVAARRLNKAVSQLRQVQFGRLDAMLHAAGEDKDLDEITRLSSEYSLMPFHEGTFFPASFGHLMGYDASYYGYMWAEVFGDDMFSRFEEEGVTNPDVGMAYRREVLERGGTRDADDLLRAFLGRESDNSAFLRKLGITGTND